MLKNKVFFEKSRYLNVNKHPKKFLSNKEKAETYLALNDKKRIVDISKKLMRPYTTMHYYKKPSKREKILEPQHKRKGRYEKKGTKLTKRQKELIEGWLRSDEVHSSHQAWQRISNVKNTPKVCYNVVNSYIKTLGHWMNPRLKTVISAKNKELRVKYCRKYRNLDLSRVLFSDECSIELNLNTVKSFAFKGELVPTQVKYNPNYSVMVWAGISLAGVTPLVFIEGWVEATDYIDILEEQKRNIKALFGRGKWYFQQDNARPHSAEESIAWIKANLTRHIPPPYSAEPRSQSYRIDLGKAKASFANL